MKLITRIELSQRSDGELAALFQAVSRQLVCSEEQSPARRNALASLENIRSELTRRRGPKPR